MEHQTPLEEIDSSVNDMAILMQNYGGQEVYGESKTDLAMDAMYNIQHPDAYERQNPRFTTKVNKIINNYKWPLPKENASVEE